jgi:hypothetical protein
VTEVKAGAVFTVKAPFAVTVPPSVFVIVRFRAETVALGAMVTLAVSEVALLKVVEFTVMPVPLRVTAAPVTKPVPVMVSSWLTAPWPRVAGLTEVKAGAAFTVKAPFAVTVPPSVLVIVRFRADTVALGAMVTFAVSEVALLKVVEFTVIPVPLRVTVAPVTKPVPVIVRSWLTAPWPRVAGLTEVKVGAGFTVNAEAAVIVPASGLVRIRSRTVAAAPPATVTVTVKEVALLNVTLLTVIPVPLKLATTPSTKPVPTTARAWLDDPCGRLEGVTEVKADAAFTVKAPFAVTVPPSVLVIVRFRAETVALGAMVTFAVSEVALLKVTPLTVIPVPLRVTFAPVTKPVPVMVSSWLTAPWPRVAGLTEVKVGAGFTVNADEAVIVPASGLVRIRSRAVAAAPPATETLIVSEVALLNVTLLTVIPVPLKEAVMPSTKPVPTTSRAWLDEPCGRLTGVTEVKAGAAFTVKAPFAVTVPPSVLVIVRFRADTVALGAMVTLAVSEVALLKVVEFTVIPVPLKVTAAPVTKPVPVIVRSWLADPWPRVAGLTEVKVGAGFTVKADEAVIVPASGFVRIRSRAVAAAPPATETFTVSEVALLKVVE